MLDPALRVVACFTKPCSLERSISNGHAPRKPARVTRPLNVPLHAPQYRWHLDPALFHARINLVRPQLGPTDGPRKGGCVYVVESAHRFAPHRFGPTTHVQEALA